LADLLNTNKNQLVDRVCDFENLLNAFRLCARGKRQKGGYQHFLFNYGEKLKSIEQEIRETNNLKWSGYREFYVHDPKKRKIMAAPFRDRIVHTAIHEILNPIIDADLGCRTFACRTGLGNRAAAIRVQEQLATMGKERYCIKLDVQKYFASINHEVLYSKLIKRFSDDSLNKIIFSLIHSNKKFHNKGKGIPIGNLTSQLFANFYLTDVDKKACELLNINFTEDKFEKDSMYIRYMDDMVIIARSKTKALSVATQLVNFAKEELKLDIPNYKYVVLGKDPIPFLGYVLDESGYRVLRRNERKFVKKVKRLKKQGYNMAYLAQVKQSYKAWRELNLLV
jgi:hypothetical protein